MGEKLGLAELIVDSNGVVKGVKDASDSFRFLGDKAESEGKRAAGVTDKYLGAIEHRFFGFRHVAGALLGGFTIAGLVTGLESLVVSAAKSSDHFSEMEMSMGNMTKAADHLVAAVLGMDSSIPVFQQAMESSAGWLEKMATLVKNTPWYMMGPLGLAISAAQGGASGGTGSFIGPPAPAGYGNYGYKPTEGFIGPQGKAGWGMNPLQFYDNGKLVTATKAIREYSGALGDMHIAFETFPDDTEVVKKFWDAVELGDKQLAGLETSDPPTKKFVRELAALNQALTAEQLQFELATAASDAFGQSLANTAASGAALSVKKLLGEIIIALGQVIIAYGGAMMAKGFLTYNFAEVAKGAGFVALGAATIAIGSRMAASASGASSGSVNPGLASSVAPSAGQNQPNLTLIVRGSLLGTSRGQLSREIVTLWRQGARDMGFAAS